jgi:hypothetical protein
VAIKGVRAPFLEAPATQAAVTGTTISVTPTSAEGDLVIDFLSVPVTPVIHGQDQVVRRQVDDTTRFLTISTKTAPLGANTSMSWSWTGSYSASLGSVAIKAGNYNYGAYTNWASPWADAVIPLPETEEDIAIEVEVTDLAGRTGSGDFVVTRGGAAGLLSKSDDFNRSDGGLGANWTTHTFSGNYAPTISSNIAVGSASGNAVAYWSADTFGNDQKVCADVSSGTNQAYVMARASTTARTYYIFGMESDWKLRKCVDGTCSSLATYSGITPSRICISAVGTSITPSYDSTTLASVTDSSISSGQPGVAFYLTGSTLDNWTAEEVE